MSAAKDHFRCQRMIHRKRKKNSNNKSYCWNTVDLSVSAFPLHQSHQSWASRAIYSYSLKKRAHPLFHQRKHTSASLLPRTERILWSSGEWTLESALQDRRLYGARIKRALTSRIWNGFILGSCIFVPTLKCNCDFVFVFLTLWFCPSLRASQRDFVSGLCEFALALTVD